MTYNRDNLPTSYLRPPITAPHRNMERTWSRDWTIYWIATHWEASNRGSEWGKYMAIARWLGNQAGQAQLSRQRIHQIVKNVHWLLRDKMAWRDEKIEEYA